MASPSLQIRRVVVTGELALDLDFDPGLNVVFAEPTESDARLTNKAGKTALVELIQFGLGRRQENRRHFHFAPILDELDKLWLEFDANEFVLTVGRSLQQLTARVVLHEGPYSPNSESLLAESVDVDGLSTVLLNQLDIPAVQAKTSAGDLVPFTFPLLMRAFVLHQAHSFGAVLDKVQPDTRRTEILGFLTKIIPVLYFERAERDADLQRRSDALETRYRSVFRFLSENGTPSTADAEEAVRAGEARVDAATAALNDVQASIRLETNEVRAVGHGKVEVLRAQLVTAGETRAAAQRQLVALGQEVSRLELLIRTLEADLAKSRRVQTSSRILSTVDFSACPRCLLEVTPDMREREEHARCMLCSRPLRTTSDTPPRLSPRTDDIEAQVDEARRVLDDARRDLRDVAGQLQAADDTERGLRAVIDDATRVYVSPSLDLLLARTRDLSAAEAELARARALRLQAEALESMFRDLEELRHKREALDQEFTEARQSSLERLRRLRELFESVLRGVRFPGLVSCSIEGLTLMPVINGFSYLHTGAALAGLAVVCYHIALFQLALEVDTYFPRLLIIDSPAVGDLNSDNHERLLDYLAQMHREAAAGAAERAGDIPWQIILTTRHVTPDLEPFIKLTISGSEDRMLLRPPPVRST